MIDDGLSAACALPDTYRSASGAVRDPGINDPGVGQRRQIGRTTVRSSGVAAQFPDASLFHHHVD